MIRLALSLALSVAILPALPALAADPIAPPPAPERATYDVWVFKLVGGQWIKQDALCLKTADVMAGINYVLYVNAARDWIAMANLPASAIPDEESQNMPSPASKTPAGTTAPPQPPDIEYAVWGFRLIDGKWVKQDDHCFTSKYGSKLLDYIHEINRFRGQGWYATSNIPVSTFLNWKNLAQTGDSYPEGQYAIGNGYVHTQDGRIVYDPEFSPGGRTVYRPHMTVRVGRDANRNVHYDPPPQ
jgi:hypothetical protein